MREQIKKEIEDDIGIGYTLATGRLFVSFKKFHEFSEKLLGKPISHIGLFNNFGNEKFWERLRRLYEKKRLITLTKHNKK